MTLSNTLPVWLPLLIKPYEDILGSRTNWDLRLPDGTRAQVERAGQGLNKLLLHVRYDGADYACKLFVVDERRRVEREWAALKALDSAGSDLAPAPVALAIDGPLPQPAIVSTWIEGKTLGERTMEPADVSQLIVTIAQIHATGPVPGQSFLPVFHPPGDYREYLDQARGFVAQVQSWAMGLDSGDDASLPRWAADLPSQLPLFEAALRQGEAAVEAAGADAVCPAPALVRVDGNLDNIIQLPDRRLAFLDWEYSGWGDPAYDLPDLRWHPRALTKISQHAWDLALEQYPVRRGDPLFRTRLAMYDRLLPVWWVGRTALHLLEGAGRASGRKRLVRLPDRLFRAVRRQLDRYLAALDLIEAPEEDEREGD